MADRLEELVVSNEEARRLIAAGHTLLVQPAKPEPEPAQPKKVPKPTPRFRWLHTPDRHDFRSGARQVSRHVCRSCGEPFGKTDCHYTYADELSVRAILRSGRPLPPWVRLREPDIHQPPLSNSTKEEQDEQEEAQV